MEFRLLLGFLAIFFSVNTNASEPYSYTKEEIIRIRNALPQLEKDRVFYHWTNPTTGIAATKEGRIPKPIFEKMRKLSDGFFNVRAHGGPGFYIAELPNSSKGFGPIPLALKIKKETRIYKIDIVAKELGISMLDKKAQDPENLLGREMPMIRAVKDDWWLTTSEENTLDVHYAKELHGGQINPIERFNASSAYPNFESWLKIIDEEWKISHQNLELIKLVTTENARLLSGDAQFKIQQHIITELFEAAVEKRPTELFPKSLFSDQFWSNQISDKIKLNQIQNSIRNQHNSEINGLNCNGFIQTIFNSKI